MELPQDIKDYLATVPFVTKEQAKQLADHVRDLDATKHQPDQTMKTTTKTITTARTEYLRSLNLDGAVTWAVTGPRGGRSNNASGTPSAGWTRAAHLAGLRSVPYWSGSNPTPARHFAPAIVRAMFNAPASIR